MMKKILVLAMLLLGLAVPAQNQPSGVIVTGKGTVKVVPDEVLIKVRVENEGNSASDVKSATDKAVDAVLKFLKKEGVDSKNVQTEYIRLDKNYQYNTKTYIYNANQAISILLKDIKDYEEIMTGLINSGINRIDGIQFKSSEMEKYESQARIKAIENAKMKAEEYAKAVNQRVGKAYAISEAGNNSIQPVYRSMEMKTMDSSSGQETLAVGEMDITAEVNVNFTLLD